MGGSASSPIPGGGTSGYHVLRVQDGSPGHKAGLEAFFDFIVAIGDKRLEEDNDSIKDLLQANKDRPVHLIVYSTKSQSCREVTLTPNNHWGGQGLMGVSIRYCSFDRANENVWHVLSVEPKSPADLAGLKPHTDYIIGANSVLNNRDDFFDLIDSSDGHVVQLYVYNSESDSCREVHLKPDSNWGGNGLLGCNIGYGYLHRIPTATLTPPTSSPQLLGESLHHPQESAKMLISDSKLSPVSSSGRIVNGVAAATPCCPLPPPYTFNNTPSSTFAEVPLVSSSMQLTPQAPQPPATTVYPTRAPVNPVDHFTHSHNPVPPSAFIQSSNIPPPAPLPSGLTNIYHIPSTSGVPAFSTEAPLISFEHTTNTGYVPQYSHHNNMSQMSTAQYFHPVCNNDNSNNNKLPASTVISLPGMPPLDVKMPPLESLNLPTNQSSYATHQS
ncbi:Golgi reassembly-stacking protein isoform 1 [Schistosoma japonicum]|uniref:Golgi reassembly-stacking protein isoform 1 n=5 Tax=Schistosoma japonicum TaxID=6182 RepID=A0A4Z2D540_SCHJA|nr:Golgi reassembly-stacking protein 2 [Schistosoma japonicum]TNN11586.1 Golgi reassembly-stacking protein isoform 1 [Schistosoma japonicum]